MKTKSLTDFFYARSVAVVGASDTKGKVGNVVAENLLHLGYKGKVFLVNPKHQELLGQTCYPSIEKIGEKIDLAIIIVPAKIVTEVVKKAAGKCKNFVVISAGFSETGEAGKNREQELLDLAENKGLNILGPNCLGFIIPELKLNASFAGGMPEAGNIAFISQSGALAVALMDIARREQLRFSNIFSVGNKMQLDESVLLEYLEEDPKTKVIGMYLEGIKNGKRFLEVAERVSRKKPIVILKSGKTERAQRAIASHTGALAGSDAIIGAAFDQAGIIRVENLETFVNILGMISYSAVPRNSEVAVVTNAGGPGVLTTDAFRDKEIQPAIFPEEAKKALRSFLPEEASVENPVDLLGDAGEERYKKTLETIGKGAAGSVIVVLTPQDQTPVEKIAEAVVDFKKSGKKNVIAAFIGGDRVAKAVEFLKKNGVPNFSFPEQAVVALDIYYHWGRKIEKKKEKIFVSEDLMRRKKVAGVIKKAKAEGHTALFFSEAKEVVSLYGVTSVDAQVINPGERILLNSEINFPVVVKVDSDKVLHKTDKNGLILNIQDEKALLTAVSQIQKNFSGAKVIIQPMLPIKTELIVGISQDPIFGPVVMVGLGGIYTEIFKMVDFFVGTPDIYEIKEKLLSGKIGFLFRKTRGQDPCDVLEVARLIRGVAEFAAENPEVKEFDINPLLIYNDGRKAMAVDVKVLI